MSARCDHDWLKPNVGQTWVQRRSNMRQTSVKRQSNQSVELYDEAVSSESLLLCQLLFLKGALPVVAKGGKQ